VFGFLSAVIFLGEDVTASDAVGAVLVGASVLYFAIFDRRNASADLETSAISTSVGD
jgi:drug/metabolite transporter (DMT)-like permease